MCRFSSRWELRQGYVLDQRGQGRFDEQMAGSGIDYRFGGWTLCLRWRMESLVDMCDFGCACLCCYFFARRGLFCLDVTFFFNLVLVYFF